MAATLLAFALVATMLGCTQAVIIPNHPCPFGDNWVQVVSFNVIPAEETIRTNGSYNGVTFASESTFSLSFIRPPPDCCPTYIWTIFLPSLSACSFAGQMPNNGRLEVTYLGKCLTRGPSPLPKR